MRRVATAAAAVLLLIPAAEARVTRLEIAKRQPFAVGQAFGPVGFYELLEGRFHGEIDPKHPLNKVRAMLADWSNIPPTFTSSSRSTSQRETARCSTT
jgi:hypothetical protein